MFMDRFPVGPLIGSRIPQQFSALGGHCLLAARLATRQNPSPSRRSSAPPFHLDRTSGGLPGSAWRVILLGRSLSIKFQAASGAMTVGANACGSVETVCIGPGDASLHTRSVEKGRDHLFSRSHRRPCCSAYVFSQLCARGTLAMVRAIAGPICRSEEHTSELQSPCNLVCRLLLEKK